MQAAYTNEILYLPLQNLKIAPHFKSFASAQILGEHLQLYFDPSLLTEHRSVRWNL